MARVLVIDDNKLLADVLADGLAAAGHEVSAAYDGVTALQMAQLSDYDLILSDIQMAPWDGLATVRALIQKTRAKKYLFMTGFASEEQLADAKTLSGREVLMKPFGATALMASIA